MMDAEDFDVWFAVFLAAVAGHSPFVQRVGDVEMWSGQAPQGLPERAAAVADAGLIEVRKRQPKS